MNQTIRELMERKSVRVYTGEPIGKEEKEMILRAAMEAPTAGNQQLYTILDITDPALKRELAETCDHQPFIAEADLVLIFCADCLKWLQAFKAAGCSPRRPEAGDLMLAAEDAAIAAQNAVVAAHSLGLGSCYIGDILERREDQARILGCPCHVVPAVMLVIGHPTEGQLKRVKPVRLPLEDIVFENRYPEQDDAGCLRALEPKRTGTGTPEDWARAFCERKWNSDFSREMTRSAAAILADFATEAS